MINRPVVLVGASMGGAVAIDFATTYPDAVEIALFDREVGIGTRLMLLAKEIESLFCNKLTSSGRKSGYIVW
jgi:pimeloyl-ACP methyl ester carboxylesterase